MLVSEEKRYPLVRGIGAGLFLLTVAAFAQVLHPIQVAESLGFFKRCGVLYGAGAFTNGGLTGGLIGGGLDRALDTPWERHCPIGDRNYFHRHGNRKILLPCPWGC